MKRKLTPEEREHRRRLNEFSEFARRNMQQLVDEHEAARRARAEQPARRRRFRFFGRVA
jgi:hypothetical protein